MTAVLALTAFAAVHVGLGVIAARRRFIARLAVREVVRRRWQSLLVVVGLAVGSAGVTAALIAGDAVDESALLNACRTWAGTDVVVAAPDGTPFPATIADDLRDDPVVARATDGVQAGFEVVAPIANPAARAVDGDVRVIGFDPATQAPFGVYGLTDGTETHGEALPAGHVLVTERLADSLRASTGDRLAIALPNGPHEVTIGGVVRSEGAGAYGLRPAVHAPLAALGPLTADGQVNIVRVSAVGDVRAGVDASPAARAAVEEVLAGLAHALEVREVKAAELEGATAGTAWFRAMLGGLSTLLGAAGLTLVVNLALMLAEARRSRLGILRAVGLRRRDLIRLAVLEGAIYRLAATVLGVAVGTALGSLLARQFVVALTQISGDVVDLCRAQRRSVLGAFNEVEVLLSNIQLLEAQGATALSNLNAAEESFRIAQVRYEEGVADYQTVLQSQNTLFSSRNAWLDNKLLQLNAMVGLYQALGGGWEAPAP